MKVRYLLTMMFIFIPSTVLAAPNANISTSASSIENGKSVTATVTLTDTAAWNVAIAGSGAATCYTKQADVTADGKSTTKDFTLTCDSTQVGTITFNVTGDITSENGETKDISLSKQVTVNPAKSSVNTLSDLKVDGITVSGFSSTTTSYNLKDNNASNVNITATATDSKASISGTGNKTLNYGKNTFNVVVKAENGNEKTYTIIVNKPDTRSSNNYLKSLRVNKGTLNFDKNTTNYTIKLEHNAVDISITATAEDSKANVFGAGVKTLKDYNNEFKVAVTAENGETKTYNIKVIRKDANGNYGKLSEDNSVKSISITGYDFKFDKDVKKYNILAENIDNIEINVIPNDSTATISIQNNNNLKSGLNKVVVQIVAENGDKNEYLFNVYNIGKEEDTTIGSKIEAETKKTNIWMIISGIELIGIVILLIILLKRK